MNAQMSWLTPKEAAPILGLTTEGVYDAIKSRRLGAVQDGPRCKIRISRNHIEEYLRRYTIRPTTLSHHNKADGLEIPSLLNS